MITPPATILPLTSEDFSEYEAIKKNWPKIKAETSIQKKGAADPNLAHKKEVQDRIGLTQQQQQRK
jgi:hypothetical protein